MTESERRGHDRLELTTAPGDMGKIIGRQGRTAAALRTLVALTAEQHGVRAQLESGTEIDVRDPGFGISGLGRTENCPSPESRVPNPEWDRHGARGTYREATRSPGARDRHARDRLRRGAISTRARRSGRDRSADEEQSDGQRRRECRTGGRSIGFEGFATIEDVERLAGLELRVPEDVAAAAWRGRLLRARARRMRRRDDAGERVGEVRRVEGGAGASVLSGGGRAGGSAGASRCRYLR